MYGPRIGAIYHAPGMPCQPPLFVGGGQERNRRSGTENTPMAVGLGEAARSEDKTSGRDLDGVDGDLTRFF